MCRALEQPRSTQRHEVPADVEEDRLRDRITVLACAFGRYGYRRITELLKVEGWQVNHKHVRRIWRQEGLKVPQKQQKRKRLWLNRSSCVRFRPMYPNHVWSYDFLKCETSDGRVFRILNVIDEYTRKCLLTYVARKIRAIDVLEQLADLFIMHGTPDHIRSDNGPEFIAEIVRSWLQRLGVQTLFIELGSPWESGYVESFNGKMRDELLNGEIFDTILEARVVIGNWRELYNTIRPHSSLGYRPPAPEVFKPLQLANG